MQLQTLHDTQLRHLEHVTDPTVMATHFAKYFDQATPGYEVSDCAIEKIYYRPGQSCTLLYRVSLRNGTDAKIKQWFFGKVFPHKRARKRFDEIVAQSGADNGVITIANEPQWQPISFWPELDMTMWSFPHDPKMDWLSRMVDLAFIKDTVNASRAEFGFEDNWRAERVTFDRVKYMPGKRCVLRYHVEFAGPEQQTCKRTFYSKTYHDAKSRYHFDILRAAYEHSRNHAAFVQIPRPIRHLEEVNTFWQEEWPGAPLIDVLHEQNWETLFPRLGLALADLHKSAMPGLRPGPEMTDALKTAADDAAELMFLAPQLRDEISRWMDCLTTQHPVLAQAEIPTTTTHGAIRLEQMLIRGEELALIDFDALALGDPLADVAEFIASLQFLELSQELSRPRLLSATSLFSASYAQQVPWAFASSRLAWYALAFLISKMFLAVKNLDRRSMQYLESAGMMMGREWCERLVGKS